MIIRHDLSLVFIHVPKCAGKKLRWIFKQGAKPQDIDELWNYEHNSILDRYVDLAHLPLSDLRTYPQFKYLNQYTVVACIRNPYMRLRSAVNEYYRQKSKQHEALVNSGALTMEMHRAYYRKMKRKHSELDPRYIHSLPIHRFTHYGAKAKVDHLLRCENLVGDIVKLSTQLNWPQTMQKAIQDKRSTLEGNQEVINLTKEEIELAERVYEVDFETFGYEKRGVIDMWRMKKERDAGKVKQIHNYDAVKWHWGPKAQRIKRELKAHR